MTSPLLDMCSAWPFSEHLFVVALITGVHGGLQWLFCFFFIALDCLGWCKQYKLPREKSYMDPLLPQNIALDHTAFWEQIVGTCLGVPLFAWGLYPAMKMRGCAICVGDGHISLLHLIYEVGIMIIGCDFLFYWIHRALHLPLFYKHIHRRHHEYKASNIWASGYFSIPDLILNILPGILPGLLIGADLSSLLVFTALREWQSIQSHAGYDLPWDLCNRGPFVGGARRHDFHHSHNVGCYGDWFPWWDYICGTDVAYQKYYSQGRKSPKPVKLS